MKRKFVAKIMAGCVSTWFCWSTAFVNSFWAAQIEYGVLPDYGYQKIYEIHDAADWIQPDIKRRSFMGDYNLDGRVTLGDAQKTLCAALGIQNADVKTSFQVRYTEDHDGVNLHDAFYALQTALGVIEQRLIDLPNIYTVFESLEFNKWKMITDQRIFHEKEELLLYARQMNNAELEQAVMALPDYIFDSCQALLVAQPVYASRLSDVEITDVACKKTIDLPPTDEIKMISGNYAVLKDGDQSVLDSADNQYVSLTLMSEKTTDYVYGDEICVQRQINGGETAILHTFSENVGFAALGLEKPIVIRSTQELKAFKEQLKNCNQQIAGDEWTIATECLQLLEKDDDYFKNKTLVIGGETSNSMSDRRTLTWEKNQQSVAFQIKTDYFRSHELAPENAWVYNFYVMETSNELMENRVAQLNCVYSDQYYDYAPIQKTFALDQVTSKYFQMQKIKITDKHEQDDAIMLSQSFCNDESALQSPEYQSILREIEEIDLEKYDAAIILTNVENHGAEEQSNASNQTRQHETMFASFCDDDIKTCLSGNGLTYNEDKMLVTFLYFDKGMIGARLPSASFYIPKPQ